MTAEPQPVPGHGLDSFTSWLDGIDGRVVRVTVQGPGVGPALARGDTSGLEARMRRIAAEEAQAQSDYDRRRRRLRGGGG